MIVLDEELMNHRLKNKETLQSPSKTQMQKPKLCIMHYFVTKKANNPPEMTTPTLLNYYKGKAPFPSLAIVWDKFFLFPKYLITTQYSTVDI